jgi:two-component system OmpR family response regulator
VRILLVGEDNQLCKKIASRLSESSYQIDIAENLKDAEYYIDIRNYDLILADVSSLNSNGIDLLNTVKKKFSRVFFILVSDSKDKDSEISAFKAGVDDYIAKPFDFDILVARIEARLRFGGTNVIKIDDLVINPDEEKIIYKGKEIELKGKPFEVLTHLARHKVQIVSKEQLLDAIWEEPELVTPNVIEVAINQIRQKMDKPLKISTIETIRRRGYRFCYPKSD